MRKFKLGIGTITVALLLIGVIAFSLFTGYRAITSNKDFLQIDYEFKKVVIKLPNDEVVTGEVAEWTTYDNKDTVKVKLKNGKQYLGHSSDIVLYND